METHAQQQTRQQPAPETGEMAVREKHQLSKETSGTHEGRYFEPRVNIHETADALVLTADVPGAVAEDITTDLKDNLLTFVARVGPVEAKWKPLYEEYDVGHYMRSFKLGQQIDQSKISARLKDGVLTLTLPKAERHKPRRIAVKGE
jgi:HSP20 family protein